MLAVYLFIFFPSVLHSPNKQTALKQHELCSLQFNFDSSCGNKLTNNHTLYSGRHHSRFSCVCLAQHWFYIYKPTYAHGSPEGDGSQHQCPAVIGLFMPAALIYLARDLSSLCQPTKPFKLKAHWPLLSILSLCSSLQINIVHPDN